MDVGITLGKLRHRVHSDIDTAVGIVEHNNGQYDSNFADYRKTVKNQ